jgi:hypothetical protein
MINMSYFTKPFTHPPADARHAHASWFMGQRLPQSSSKSVVDDWHNESVVVLKAFHDDEKNAQETAFAITRPISSSPIPDLGSYSNESIPLTNLWGLFHRALLEWPANRVPDLFAVLEAIGKVPDKLFHGEMTSDGGCDEPLTWAAFPYFAADLNDTHECMQPGQLCRMFPDPEAVATARTLYLRLQDMEAQCVARHIFESSDSLIRYISNTLEKPIDELDQQTMPAFDHAKGRSFNSYNEATAYHQVKLEWNIPAVTSWFRYNAQKIYDVIHASVCLDEVAEKSKQQCLHGSERWEYWKQRLAELAASYKDERVRISAREALKYIEGVNTRVENAYTSKKT